MVIELSKDSKVFVAAPAMYASGGPELLHQLVYHLRNDLNIEAYMFYYPDFEGDPVPSAFKVYNNPYSTHIDDNCKNVFIVPEIRSGISLLNNYKKIRKAIWWLSVDNFIQSYLLGRDFLFIIKKLFYKIVLNDEYGYEDILKVLNKDDKNFEKYLNREQIKNLLKDVNYHLCQSHYSMDFLRKIGIGNIYYLSDYINKDFLNTDVDISKKENIVVFNPKKGEKFTKKIISYYRGDYIKFIPLINMSREEVIDTLKKAKVYIDFGNHPGKDRIPREAAILGCCVITSKNGSAKYKEDVPIPDSYKFEDKDENIPKIISKIEDCLVNFRDRYNDFKYYREFIKNEPHKFLEDLKNVFRLS